MNIEKHISDLLYRYQCVTVPGFGAFITETVPAAIKGSAATFIPPRKVVSFNANIVTNDGLLANHIALQNNISFEKATEKIADNVSQWVSVLEKTKTLTLANIGTILVSGSENNWVFEPNTTTNFLTSSFGLNQFVSPEIKREVYVQQVEELEEKAPIAFTPERKKNSYAFLKYAAVFAILGTIGLFGYKQYYDNQIETQTLLVQKNVQEKVQQQLQQATFFIDAPSVAVELPVAEEKLPYHIIAGAFRSEENAKKAMRLLTEQGYKAHILPQSKHGLYPVTYGSFKTVEEAELLKQKVHNEGNNDAWLLIE